MKTFVFTNQETGFCVDTGTRMNLKLIFSIGSFQNGLKKSILKMKLEQHHKRKQDEP